MTSGGAGRTVRDRCSEPGAASAPDGCQVLDLPGGTVLPGLVDAHVHLCADGTAGTLDRIGEPGQDAIAAVIEQSLQRHLAAGVTTVRDLGTAVSPCSTGAHACGAHGLADGVDGIEHCSFLTDKGPSQSEQDLARLAEAGTAVCPTPGMAGTPEPTPNAAALLAKLGMTFEQVMEMNKRRVGQMHAAGVRVVAGSDGGIAAAKPHGLLPVSVAFLVEGGVSTVAALASATALAAAACGLGDRKGRLRAGYDADLLVVDGDPVADIGALARPAAVFAGGRRPAGAA